MFLCRHANTFQASKRHVCVPLFVSLRRAFQCILCVSYVDEDDIRLVKMSHKERLQDAESIGVQARRVKFH